MIVVDVNVLVAAHLADHPHHAVAHRFLTQSLADDAVIVPDAVWVGFLRIVTNRRIFDTPATLDDALAFLRAVTGADGYRAVAGLVDGIEVFVKTVEDAAASANLVPNAYIASVAFAHDCAVATFDRDFRRFDGLRIVTPA